MNPNLRYCALTLLLTSLIPQAQAQSFEVISIKPNNTGSGSTSESTRPGRVMDTNVSVSEVIQSAFGIKDFQIAGAPGWVASDRYDVTATTGTTKDLSELELQPYFQALLADRCKLRFYRETRELVLYSLVVAKNGAARGATKLIPHPGEGESSTNVSNGKDRTSISAKDIPMAHLANILGASLHRVVIDHTGLSGGYDLSLDWTPEPPAGSDTSGESSGPSLFAALQEQLGLKLESTKGPVDIIVVDNIEKPTDN